MERGGVVKVGALNCVSDLAEPGTKDRCPYCNLWHLRAGYCQALDPENPGFSMEALKVAGARGHILLTKT